MSYGKDDTGWIDSGCLFLEFEQLEANGLMGNCKVEVWDNSTDGDWSDFCYEVTQCNVYTDERDIAMSNEEFKQVFDRAIIQSINEEVENGL